MRGAPTFPAIDFDDFHRATLLERALSDAGRAAARDTADAPPIAFRLPDGRAYRFASAGGAIDVAPGTDAAPMVVDLDEASWADFVHELQTAAGLFYAGRLPGGADAYAALERWEPALRALFEGRPIFDPARVELRDRRGEPLDVARSFTLDEATDELRHFLDATGYLHVRAAFDSDEIAALAAIVERFADEARPGDGTSWWTTRDDGTEALCRLIYLGLRSPEVAALGEDPRLSRLAGLGTEPLRAAVDRADGHSVVIKVPGAASGLADLPMHRDCGLGGHPVTCPTLLVGIQLDAATAATGQLRFVPGSWRSSHHRHALARAAGAAVAIDTEPGDCTVHWSDVLHAAPPPRGRGGGRRTLYLAFMPERALSFIGPGQSYNDVIRARVGGA